MGRTTQGVEPVVVKIDPIVYHAAVIVRNRNPEKFVNISAAITYIFETYLPREMRVGREIVERLRDDGS